ncbi:hypothetical protein Aca07nite_29040 [Actinoplanes capillaceus]|uniref:DUF4034 domain-containing protein n=2 Tax=Actinoplanes campanulatus TaxID=113559 RepID=A0ABQ3WHB8_9ACTN|nr:hypothetical protein Aca07nite_29040 [Actinoplanes capillaceus]
MLPAMLPRQSNLDPAAAYPKITTLRAALDAGDWPASRELLDAAEQAERSYLTAAVADVDGLEDFLRGVLRGDPGDGTAGALLGQHLVEAAWAIRTRARAGHVSREQFVAFRAGLVEAERVLVDAAARSPEDPAIWTARLVTARGLRLGLSEIRRRYGRLAEIDSHHLPGQQQMLQSLCAKWYGDAALTYEFAKEAAAAAPAGAPNPVLLAEAYIEHSEVVTDVDRVRAELREAAMRSVWHPDFRRTHGWVRTMSTFAMAFVLLDDQPAAASLFDALGGRGSRWPWEYLGDPAATIEKFRARAGGNT